MYGVSLKGSGGGSVPARGLRKRREPRAHGDASGGCGFESKTSEGKFEEEREEAARVNASIERPDETQFCFSLLVLHNYNCLRTFTSRSLKYSYLYLNFLI